MNKALAFLYSKHCLCHLHSKSTACNFSAKQRRESHSPCPGNPQWGLLSEIVVVDP
jgi:hypothetical protein